MRWVRHEAGMEDISNAYDTFGKLKAKNVWKTLSTDRRITLKMGK
jgi:hypothetical protein